MSNAVRTASNNTIWVGGFFAHMKLERLYNEFAKFGEIGSLIRGGKGWAVITYVRPDDASHATSAIATI